MKSGRVFIPMRYDWLEDGHEPDLFRTVAGVRFMWTEKFDRSHGGSPEKTSAVYERCQHSKFYVPDLLAP